MTRPIFFCDFDGVLNAFPFEDVWTGPDDITSYDKVMHHPEYWEKQRLLPNLKTHFDLDKEIVIEDSNGVRHKIIYSSELIERIKNLIHMNTLEFVWLTAWREQTQTLLNPLFDFPVTTPYLHWYSRRSDYNEFGKTEAITQAFEAHPEANDIPFVWVDDVATKNKQNLDTTRPNFVDNQRNYHRSEFSKIPAEKLIIATDPRWGISRKELAAIENFAQLYADLP